MRYSNDELAHFGVLGMKWGKHKSKTSNSSNSPKPYKHYDSLVSKYSQKGYSPQEAAAAKEEYDKQMSERNTKKTTKRK
nr:MAG TPA: hypothetical protein [Caudoviricetes sp.]